ncbi:MAG: hypothetical protein ACJ762_16755 [Solirubrobacteraceae bacterium]
MLSSTTLKKSATTLAAMAALGLGGSAIAGAASTSKSGSSSKSSTARSQNDTLSAENAAKVKAAALAKVPDATVLRTEAGGPYGTPYHAHIKAADGTLKVVTVNAAFEAVDVVADQSGGRGGRGGRHGGHGGPGNHQAETALTGDTKDKVEAAVKAKYPDATILRTETNTDGSAPYESHITTGGKELEVQVSKDFEVVASNAGHSHP